VLYLTLNPAKVDVNVHPTKSEVRFSEEKKVFDAVYYAALNALQERSGVHTAEIKLSPTTEKVAAPQANPGFYKKMTSEEFRAGGYAAKAAEKPSRAPAPAPAQTKIDLSPRTAAPIVLRDGGGTYALSPSVPRPEIPRISAEKPRQKAPENAVSAPETPPEAPEFRVIGEALDTYILVETGADLLLIDKHACHERILFDKLQAGLGPQMRQTLLVPVTWSPGAEDAEMLEQNAALLAEAGFELERFGDDGVILRAVPADAEGNEVALLEELSAALRSGKPEDRRETLCHTIACKAAIKAGRRSEIAELETLALAVVSGQVRYCPHGRPVSVKLTKTELDKQFKRIV
jgi:DNA mismatch repair protein MutL